MKSTLKFILFLVFCQTVSPVFSQKTMVKQPDLMLLESSPGNYAHAFATDDTGKRLMLIKVINNGGATALASMTQVKTSGQTLQTIDTPVLKPKESITLYVDYPESCQQVGAFCRFSVVVDVKKQVKESNENNNKVNFTTTNEG